MLVNSLGGELVDTFAVRFVVECSPSMLRTTLDLSGKLMKAGKLLLVVHWLPLVNCPRSALRHWYRTL